MIRNQVLPEDMGDLGYRISYNETAIGGNRLGSETRDQYETLMPRFQAANKGLFELLEMEGDGTLLKPSTGSTYEQAAHGGLDLRVPETWTLTSGDVEYELSIWTNYPSPSHRTSSFGINCNVSASGVTMTENEPLVRKILTYFNDITVPTE